MEQTLEQTQELRPELRQRLEALLANYQVVKVDADLTKAILDKEVATIYALLKDEGIEKTELGEIKLTEVGGESSKFDPKKFVAAGGNLDHYKAAIVKKPKKKYLKITIGKEKPEQNDDE